MNILSAVLLSSGMISSAVTAADSRLPYNNTGQQVLERGANHNRIQLLEQSVGENGQLILSTITFTQLEDGLNYWSEEANSYIPSEERIELDAKGNAVAIHGQQKLVLSGNVNDPLGVVDLTGADGNRIRASPLALKYYDPVTRRCAHWTCKRHVWGIYSTKSGNLQRCV